MAVTFNYAYPSWSNPFIPSFNRNGTGRLIVDYARNWKKFLVNRLVTITSIPEPSGHYLRFDQSVLSRVSDPNESVWVDGQPFPAGEHHTQKFQFIPYTTVRHARGYFTGYDTKKNAVWDTDAQAERVLGNMMMTERNVEFYNLIQNSDNYLTDNTATATAAGGGKWSAATTSNNYIQKSIDYAIEKMMLATNGVVNREDFTLLLSPKVAHSVAATQEVRETLIQSVYALPLIQGRKEGQNTNYNLPKTLYGVNVEVDPSIQNRALAAGNGMRDMTPNYRFFAGDDEAVLLCRPGDIMNTGDFATAYSSVHMFSYFEYEMKMETVDLSWDKRIRHQVSDQREFKIVSPETMFLFTDVL